MLFVNSTVGFQLEMVVHHQHHDLITHPVVKKLIKVKWRQFGRFGAILQLVIFLIFLVVSLHSILSIAIYLSHCVCPGCSHYRHWLCQLLLLTLRRNTNMNHWLRTGGDCSLLYAMLVSVHVLPAIHSVVCLQVVSFVLFVYQVSEELNEIYRSRKQHKVNMRQDFN